jgi:signal transduction histidine kinase
VAPHDGTITGPQPQTHHLREKLLTIPPAQLEERLAQLDRLANMGTLAAVMAHEIKNALVAGKTFVDLLLEKHSDAELTELVRREMGRIDAIVGRMLRFGGPARSGFGEVRLHEVLEHSVRLIEPPLHDKSITLTCTFQAAADVVQGDAYQLQQAFVNLLLNALDATPPNGNLWVGTETLAAGGSGTGAGLGQGHSAALQVTIKDSGMGITAEDMARLFEPFFTTKPNGTGLGLSITRRIIQEHRGEITVESEPGNGTAFRIRLPAAGGPA